MPIMFCGGTLCPSTAQKMMNPMTNTGPHHATAIWTNRFVSLSISSYLMVRRGCRASVLYDSDGPFRTLLCAQARRSSQFGRHVQCLASIGVVAVIVELIELR